MTKSHAFLLGIVGILFHVSTVEAAPQSEKDKPRRNSAIGDLVKKNIPRVINLDLYMRASVNARFNSGVSGTNETSFRFDHLMFGLHGNITDRLSYKYLQRFTKGTHIFQTDNLPATIDYAYLKYQLNRQFSTTAGRQVLFVGGFEYNQSPIDLYECSLISDHTTCYLTGVNLVCAPSENQEIGVQVVNNRTGSLEESFGRIPAGVERPFAPFYYSVAWNSSYADSKLKLRYAASAGELVKGKWLFMVSGGQMLDLGKFNVYLDVLYNRSSIDHLGVVRKMATLEDGTSWDGMARSVEYLTLVTEANYRFLPKWNIHLKGFYDRASVYEDNGLFEKGNYLSSFGYLGGVEYFPLENDNLYLFLNAAGKVYERMERKHMLDPNDRFRLSMGFVYRLPVL